MDLENHFTGILMSNCSRMLLFVIIFVISFLLGKLEKKKKNSFENLKQWWDVGKTQITFCQQYSANCSSRIKNVIESLEKQINSMELQMVDAYKSVLYNDLQKKKRELSLILNEKVKGALIRSRFMSLAEMDAPTSFFFFKLEYKVAQQKQMPCLKLPDGRITYKTIEMRNHAVDFYSSLYAAENCAEKL